MAATEVFLAHTGAIQIRLLLLLLLFHVEKCSHPRKFKN